MRSGGNLLLLRKRSLADAVESIRVEASRAISDREKSRLGQYFTPVPTARLMASMFEFKAAHVRLLDAGAGIGSLAAACVERLCSQKRKPESVHVVACELDEKVIDRLEESMRLCEEECKDVGIRFSWEIEKDDFLEYAVDRSGSLFSSRIRFTHAVMNPPYFKINTSSRERELIRRLGVETSNIYTGFVTGALSLLQEGGQVVAITPRSFCNGPYFLPFRKFFLANMAIRRIHVFESRNLAFREDDVLQENIIFHAKKGEANGKVCLSSSVSPVCETLTKRSVDHARVVEPGDQDLVIHIAAEEEADEVAASYSRFRCTLKDLGIEVSTGRVVDFRAKEYLRMRPEPGAVPLIYPTHFRNGYIAWPSENGKKPNALVSCDETKSLLVPNEYFVLVKRFSAKEERRRIVAAVHTPKRLKCPSVGFENHLNFFHRGGRGLEPDLAKGLAVFLNSTVVDSFFRQFSGHTQVNATDLRKMLYPTADELKNIGCSVDGDFPTQETVDRLIESI